VGRRNRYPPARGRKISTANTRQGHLAVGQPTQGSEWRARAQLPPPIVCQAVGSGSSLQSGGMLSHGALTARNTHSRRKSRSTPAESGSKSASELATATPITALSDTARRRSTRRKSSNAATDTESPEPRRHPAPSPARLASINLPAPLSAAGNPSMRNHPGPFPLFLDFGVTGPRSTDWEER
jgi:hypothetical protein